MQSMTPSHSHTTSLEAWATERLEILGVDGVFAPYVVGMLSECDVENSEDDEEIKYNVLDVLMGWLSPEDEVRFMTHYIMYNNIQI